MIHPGLRIFTLTLLLAGVAPPAPAAQASTPIPLGDLLLTGDIYPALEGHLARELGKSVGPADRWEVRLSRTGNDLPNGRISRVDLNGTNVRTPEGLVVGGVTITIDDLKMNLESGYIEDIGGASFMGRLHEEDVERFARSQEDGPLRNLRVQFHGNRIRVSGTTKVIGIGVRVQVAGRPRLRDNTVVFDAERVNVASFRMPNSVERKLERKINPLADFARLSLPARLTSIEIADDELVARGSLVLERDVPPSGAPVPAVPGR